MVQAETETALFVSTAAQLYVLELKQGQLLIHLCTDKYIFVAKNKPRKTLPAHN